LRAEVDADMQIAYAELSSRLAKTPDKEVYIFVHGYANSFDDSVTTLAQVWHFLGRRGVRCTLIERKPEPQFLPKMERCNARTMEIFRRMGLAAKVRAAGLPAEVPMDVYIVRALNLPPLMHSPYPSVSEARRAIDACNDGTLPLEPYQLISQYTLEPLLKSIAEGLCSVRYGCEFQSFTQDAGGVTTRTSTGEIRSRYLVGCDGGGSMVRRQLGIELKGEADILRLRDPDRIVVVLDHRVPEPNALAAAAHVRHPRHQEPDDLHAAWQ